MATLSKITVPQGSSLIVEPGAMVAYGGSIEMSTDLNGPSLWNIFTRYAFGQETVFQNTFSAKSGTGWIALDRGPELMEYTLSPKESLYLASGAFVARDPQVELSTHYAGARGAHSGIGLVKLAATNLSLDKTQRVFFNAKEGLLKELKINSDEGPVKVDNKHLIAYTSNLSVSTGIPAGLPSYFLSNEEFVNTFQGTGSVFVNVGKNKQKEIRAT